MFSFLKNLRFWSKSVDTTEDNNMSTLEKDITDDNVIKDNNENNNYIYYENKNNETNDDNNETNDDNNETIDDNESVDSIEQSLKGTTDQSCDEDIDEDNKCIKDWDAFEDKNEDNINSHLDLCLNTINGVVTQVINSNEIIVDKSNRIHFTRCSYGDIEVGDLVHIEFNDKKEIIVKPLRYKILTGKITDEITSRGLFIFCKHAKLRKTPELQKFKVGDNIKALVLEVSGFLYNWRAIKYSQEKDPQNEVKDEVKEFTNELLENKFGIFITDYINFGKMKIQTKKSFIVWIKNKSSDKRTLESCNGEEGETQVKFKSFQSIIGKSTKKPFIIPPHKECYVELICDGKYYGDHNELLTFNFDGFRIGRFASVTVHDSNTESDDSIRLDFRQFRRQMFGNHTWVVPGEQVWNTTKHITDRLESYHVPEQLWKALENNWDIETVFERINEPLNKDNYKDIFHASIYLEECENLFNISQYNMKDVTLKRNGRFLALTVPGLAENRPSLIVSDKVILFDNSNKCVEKRIYYEGFIHEIRKEEILIGFHQKFHNEFRGGCFTVSFQMSRMLYRRCHHAIDFASHLVEQVLFPNDVITKIAFKQIPFESINWFNQSLNLQQKLAVVGVLRGECRPTPYIIFGPPGTGKTVTIVESILQIFDKIPESRIIACTAANSSADLIAAKLLESGRITEQDLIRITAIHRTKKIPDSVKSVTKVADEDENKWLYHRIIVTTCSQSGIIFRSKISPSHFSHTFIDEAAQCMEPESLIPLSMSAIGHGCVVLAGDHHQLGPVIMSPKAKHYGLNRSLLERLMTNCKPYQRNEKFSEFGFYNPRFVTKLLTNYRSDNQIMAIPSKLFYENELNCVNATDVELLKSMGLKNAILFIGVRGEDRQDPDSTSWFNSLEVIQCCSYLNKLYRNGVKSKDIGIITPYRKQVIKIRNHMRDEDLESCKVATIEEFQGDERRVIIASMVRSSQELISYDLKYNLGFVQNKKRFNVAISRAMSLLICIGDPFILSKDECWKIFIEFCLQNQCYSGCNFKDFVNKSAFRRKSFPFVSSDGSKLKQKG